MSRLFPEIVPFAETDLKRLAEAMFVGASPENPSIPAGYTYLGQFVAHDVSHDPTPLADAGRCVEAGRRSAALDLDSVYGPGLVRQPGMPGRLRVDPTVPDDDRVRAAPNDLPRNGAGRALIAEPLNDRHLFLAQLHVALLRFHNAVLDDPKVMIGVPARSRFEIARRTVINHFQWIVREDFLKRVMDPAEVDRIHRQPTRRSLCCAGVPLTPVEFAAAAFRFGHSMVREFYDLNGVFRRGSRKDRVSLVQVMDRHAHRLGTGWIVDWRHFFDFPDGPGRRTPTPTRQIDGQLARPLRRVRHRPPPLSLAARDLVRGNRLRLPTGQAVAHALGVAKVEPDDIAAAGPDGAFAASLGLHRRTPLWYYVLKEAEIQEGGRQLGEVGGRIVAEVLLALMEADPDSGPAHDPAWRPTLPAHAPGTFFTSDLLTYAGVVGDDLD